MTPLSQHLASMAYNNAWANHRLLKACAALSREDFGAPRVGFFPSLKATLNHTVTVDWYYVDALERALHGVEHDPRPWRFFEPEEPFESLAELAPEQRAVDRRLIAVCLGLTDADLVRSVPIMKRAGLQSEGAARLLAHLFQHQIHHRGQAHAMLAGTAVKPPQLDEFFCANEAEMRAADFAELGFTEDAIWS